VRIVQHIRKMSLLLVLAGLLLGMVSLDRESPSSVQAAPATGMVNDENLADKVEGLVLEELEAAGQTDFFVWMVEKANLGQAARLMARTQKAQFVFETLRNTAARTQMSLRADLTRQGVSYQTFYIANKILVRGGDVALVNALAARSDVARITANHTYQLDAPAVSPNPQIGILAVASNLTFINADDVWDAGYTGAGIVLAGSDTGLDWDHPAIKPHYRGWDDTTVDHNYNWWDATATYPTAPDDGHGHGTHTTGTMVGDDGGANQIGVAPGAQTMHCKALDDSGNGTDAHLTECLEWYLSPWDLNRDNPDPAKAPDAVNLSLGIMGGNALQFENEITALQAAGILVEASAGNEGSVCGTLGSPGDYRGVLTTGSVNSSGAFPGTISSFSSRGPSQPYPGAYFPDVMAPGENILSAQAGGDTYTSMSGTSMAGPHVTGLVALMWEANPDLRGMVDQTAQLIADTAAPLTGQAGSDCGGDYTDGPNNDWGHGTIDAQAAVQAALAYGSAGDIIRVTPTGATSGACGGDWDTPCDLLYALKSVATLGDELWVAEGVYKPTTDPDDQEAYIPLKTEVDVYGGFAGNETARWQRDPAANVTIFSGDIDDNDSQSPIVTDAYAVTGTTTNSYHVVAGTPTGATLDGVTITGGYGYYGCIWGWYAQFGGGLYTEGAMTLNNVTFSGNQNFRGGGLYTTALLTVTNSTFTGNYASGVGGGIYNGADDTNPILMINVTFTNNRATDDGAGAYGGGTLILNNVTFTDNWAGTNAGGLYAAGAASLTNVTFERNRGGNMGGGMHVAGTWPVTLDRVIFKENYGPNSGGGLASWSGNVTLNNVVFFGNSAHQGDAIKLGNLGGGWTLNNVLITGNGIGYAIATSGPMTLTNVTIANQGGAIEPRHPGVVIRNSIIWDHICAEGHNGCAATTVSHSIVWGGWDGTGNLNAEPLLAPLGDYGGAILSRALLPGSPAIDAGEPATCLATDMRGLPRSSPCDMGAFESQGFTFSDLTGTPQSATPNGAFVDPLGLTVTANDLNEPVAGGQVSFSAPGSGASATFTGNPATIGASGTASLTVTANDVLGSYVVTATALGVSTPAQFELSNVEGVSTTTTLTSAPNPSEYNETVTLTATATSTAGTPIGTVQFYADGVPLGAPVALVDGVARTSTSSLNTGVHQMVANYRGDPTHNVSTSNQVEQTVKCADMFTVTNANNDGVGSLRNAFDALCAEGMVTFADDFDIYLDSELFVDKALTIDGSGRRITVSGDSGNDGSRNVRVFNIASGSAVTLSHLTIVNGTHSTDGGGIYNDGTLTVLHSTIADNTSGVNGGGIRNIGVLALHDSTLSGNAAQYGGGINSTGDASLYNCTLSGNTGNSGAGGGIRQWGSTLALYNTILANGDTAGDCIVNDNSVIVANVHNLVKDGTCSAAFSGDPLLGPLADNGGDTLTHALQPSSPAIDAGDSTTCLVTDQRGEPRADLRCDIGAFEPQHADSDTVVKTFEDSIQHSFGPTWLSVTLALTDTGTLTVTKDLACAGGTCDAGEVPAIWRIDSTLSTGLPLSLSFCYTDAEIAGLDESALRAFRWDDDDVQWTTPISTGLTVDEAANCVTLTGINQFSMWTLKDVSTGDETPTAVILPSFTARSGLWRIGLLLAVGAGVVVLQRSTPRDER
jgi:serine protease AprX